MVSTCFHNNCVSCCHAERLHMAEAALAKSRKRGSGGRQAQRQPRATKVCRQYDHTVNIRESRIQVQLLYYATFVPNDLKHGRYGA